LLPAGQQSRLLEEKIFAMVRFTIILDGVIFDITM
jgi:hypothetical protein